jgi:hypothetical protein
MAQRHRTHADPRTSQPQSLAILQGSPAAANFGAHVESEAMKTGRRIDEAHAS